jgi:hypothetical protein
MATLLLPIATYEVSHAQPMSSSDSRMGARHRRYRDARAARTWQLGLHGGPGCIAIAEKAFNDGACGAAEWDWTPPTEVTAIKARFAALDYTPGTAVAGDVVATVVECRSSDT